MIIASTHQVDMAGTACIAVNSNPHRIALGVAADHTPAEHSIRNRRSSSSEVLDRPRRQ